MKKRLFLPLVAGAALALSVPVLAGQSTQTSLPLTTNIPVTGTYQTGSISDPVYSVDIAWGDMAFTYTVFNTSIWDPATHTYSATAPATWSYSPATDTSLAGNQINLTNHSNVSVFYTASFIPDPALANLGISGSISPSQMALQSPRPESNPADPSLAKSLFLTMSGDLPESFTTPTSLGYVTLSLSPTPPQP